MDHYVMLEFQQNRTGHIQVYSCIVVTKARHSGEGKSSALIYSQ